MERIISAHKVLEIAEKKKADAQEALLKRVSESIEADFSEEQKNLLNATMECERIRQEFIRVKNEILNECSVERKTKTGVRKWTDKDGNEQVIEYVVV